MRQLHAGQLRYHDFTKLLEAREAKAQKQKRNQTQIVTQQYYTQPQYYSPLTTTQSRMYNSLSSSLIASSPLLDLPKLKLPNSFLITSNSSTNSTNSNTLAQQQQQRTMFAASFQNKLNTFHLKQLERAANSNPTNPSLQYDFLSQLIQTYPEAVIDRFENYPEFATDERSALLYFSALQRMSSNSGGGASGGALKQFNLSAFNKRLSDGNGTSIDPLKMQALYELQNNKLSKAAAATQAMQILSGAAVTGAGMGMSPGGVLGVMGLDSSGGGGGLGGGAGQRGSNAKHPIHVQMQTGVSARTAAFTLVKQVIIAFVLVSAITAFVDEKGMGRAMGMGSKHVQESEGSDVRFEDVKGVKEAKEELVEIVEYLKNPKKFTRLGGKLPRGLLLTGPPGTGKTLLAKAIAGEADVPFFFASGSQFEEVYVGLGAKRIRELFEAAKKKSPAIIFIDEIDAVGGSRKLKDQSALKQTLNELLVQLDGFEENSGIIVIGATNFADSLDSALLRPGRFDKHVTVPLPDVGGRKEILEMYAKKTVLAKDVDLNILARGTTGFSGADLFNLMNQAALKASIDGLSSITMTVLEYAKDKIMMGAERKSAVILPKTAKITAFHEAGHALVATLTKGADPIHKATIMPRGQALGMVTMLPEGDQTSRTLKEMLAYMDMSMGGRVAEELVFGGENVSSGASSDIQNASRIARNMVTKFGFSDEVGIVFHDGDTGQASSNQTRYKIDEEVKKLTDESYKRAKDLLKKHVKEHHLLAETLLEYETLTGEEVRDLILNGKKPSRPIVNTEEGSRGDTSVITTRSTATSSPGISAVEGKVGSRRDVKSEP